MKKQLTYGCKYSKVFYSTSPVLEGTALNNKKPGANNMQKESKIHPKILYYKIWKCKCYKWTACSFSVSGPTAWNSLPTAVHSDLSSSSCFCHHL